MRSGSPSDDELASDDNEQEIDQLKKRVTELENKVERLSQIIDAQVYPIEDPPEDL